MRHAFKGTVADADGKIIYKAVSGTINVSDQGERIEWSGSFVIQSGETPSFIGGWIVIGDKRGAFFVSSMNQSRAEVTFEGSGNRPVA